MSQTMCPDPYPMCPQKECGHPISGCRYLGCVNTKCRENHRAQAVELKYRPLNECEFHERFDTQEMPWRPSRGVASPIYGYEVPYKPSRHFLAPELITQPTLKCNAIPTKEQSWRAQRKTFPCQTGALSGDDAMRHRNYVPPTAADEKPTLKAPAALRGSSERSSERDWKSGRHVSGKSGCETTQQDFHPHWRHIPKGGSTATVRNPRKAPGVYKRDDGEWLPPFRAPTPEMVAHQAPGCVPWQCPKKTGKKAAPECVRHQGEWQPAFRSCNPDSLVSATPPENHRPSSRQGLKHCQCRPDEWWPPWKQQQKFQPQQQLQASNADACDSLIQRNATINEYANCTHYLDDDGLRLRGEQQQVGSESTDEEDDRDEEHGEEEDEVEVAANEPPSQKAVEDFYDCDACDDEQQSGAGRGVGAANTCWSAAGDS